MAFLLAALASARLSACASSDPGPADPEQPPGCEFVVSKNELSAKIPTVGIVEWALVEGTPSSANIVYELEGADASVLNRGGEAPVDLDQADYRTLLLGLKQSSQYKFHIEASYEGDTCISPDYELPKTGSFADADSVNVTVAQAAAREPGFIVASSGTGLPNSAFIIDADGEVVWFVEGPESPTRAQMDYEGNRLWMLALNVNNLGGEMRYVSMDGEEEEHDIEGLESAHHDFTVMPGGRVAALAWSDLGVDVESDLVIRDPDGTTSIPFRIGSNIYSSSSYHANAIHYLPFDDSFTISDRTPNVFVKVSASGEPQWQLGGSCEDAPVGARCVPQTWLVTHGHHLLEDGTFVVFNNKLPMETPHVFEFALKDSSSSFTATLVTEYTGTAKSPILGDVQRLPNGNTLVTYSSEGKIVELDADWDEVQSFALRIGYSNWRPTLYGPPLRP